MKTIHDLSELQWRLSGWTPCSWRMPQFVSVGGKAYSETLEIPATVPGSVQSALRAAGKLPDWNVESNWLECEWAENRDWVYETVLPEEWFGDGKSYTLNCLGLDYCGSVLLNGEIIGEFRGSYTPHAFELTDHLKESPNTLQIVFERSPRWLGTPHFTSRLTEWKPRFNYTWDWCVRLMQIGVWDSIYIEATDGRKIDGLSCVTDTDAGSSTGSLTVGASVPTDDGFEVTVSLRKGDTLVRRETVPASKLASEGIAWTGMPVDLWYPNMLGEQSLYEVELSLTDAQGVEIDREARRVGFKEVTWARNEGAPDEADPWICVVNGKPLFLQGVNWTPILPNFAEVTETDYRKRIALYKDLGLNIFRVWGGAVLEKEVFYDLCDEAGIMVWQEFPLSSSGIDNYPPTDPKAIDEMAEIARSYIERRRHHASLIAWCGGNELINADWTPVDGTHPMLARLRRVVEENDPLRRYLPTSPSGPFFGADPSRYGQGRHWDVHGPWKPAGDIASWAKDWEGDDALFHSEMGCPGASPVDIIAARSGELSPLPVSPENPLWRLPTLGWAEGDVFAAEKGREPKDIEEYVVWSQQRQAEALRIAVRCCKDHFPKCGGAILWMGHDCYPCLANTSIVDLNGDPKPAAWAVAEVFRDCSE